jgi:putative membrane protein insertion efficiency factor
MTKESPMTNAETSPQVAVSNWSLALRHSLVIRASSLVIHGLLLAIRVYRLTISPAQAFLFGPTGGCRFTPTCSRYAMDAIREHGALAGGWMGLKRICRCHPWGRCGHDPAPKVGVGSEKVEGGIILEHTH